MAGYQVDDSAYELMFAHRLKWQFSILAPYQS